MLKLMQTLTNGKRVWSRVLQLLLWVSLSITVAAADQPPQDSVMLAERPTVSGEPTNIEVSIFIIEGWDLKQLEPISDVFVVPGDVTDRQSLEEF